MVTGQAAYTGHMRIPSLIQAMPLHGGHPALDFVNTVHSWDQPGGRDYFQSGRDVVAWMQRMGLVSPAAADRFARLPPQRSAALLRAARRLRDCLHDMFSSIGHGQEPADRELDWLNGELGRLARYRRLVPVTGSLAWQCSPSPATTASLLAPVVFAAADLLAGPELARVKECPPPDGCGWLFLDASRNGRRTWCSMQSCGNLAKVRRYRARHAP
jgi:predicted RNA-binding Zn ribbon-like protein